MSPGEPDRSRQLWNVGMCVGDCGGGGGVFFPSHLGLIFIVRLP